MGDKRTLTSWWNQLPLGLCEAGSSEVAALRPRRRRRPSGPAQRLRLWTPCGSLWAPSSLRGSGSSIARPLLFSAAAMSSGSGGQSLCCKMQSHKNGSLLVRQMQKSLESTFDSEF